MDLADKTGATYLVSRNDCRANRVNTDAIWRVTLCGEIVCAIGAYHFVMSVLFIIFVFRVGSFGASEHLELVDAMAVERLVALLFCDVRSPRSG